ncbi:retrovirus-related Pol polyprotein from transposon TNT 1-94 [Nephila pilipes]|uniref:Retrovirus-related Pol polyprotein from transposon TNT 1-94 n=1 Tax=Nephila pilipes TaxID=299642 RepID=A0A8X6MDK3_NEPPI|nr:retrovirus-related Pol polyprotein from transposon TNT 1-94 [Nephila pilipes]
MKTRSVNGKYYFLTFVVDHSRYSVKYLRSKKDKVLSKLKEYVAMNRNKFGRSNKVLKRDHGRKYIGEEIEHSLKYQECSISIKE